MAEESSIDRGSEPKSKSRVTTSVGTRVFRITAFVVIMVVITIMCIDAPPLLRILAHIGRLLAKFL